MTGPRAGLWRLECLHAYFYHHFTNDISRPPVLAAAALAPSVATAATRAPQATTSTAYCSLPHMQQPHIPPVPTHSLQDPLWRARQQRPMSQTPHGNLPCSQSPSHRSLDDPGRCLSRLSPCTSAEFARLFPLPSSTSPSPRRPSKMSFRTHPTYRPLIQFPASSRIDLRHRRHLARSPASPLIHRRIHRARPQVWCCQRRALPAKASSTCPKTVMTNRSR
ncbi:hypothetical protein C8F01DRAFT_1237819 [Mycena amicta]|nr:hypothetical protein C8F01DRAFT_1237819 [Mycena amicta]